VKKLLCFKWNAVIYFFAFALRFSFLQFFSLVTAGRRITVLMALGEEAPSQVGDGHKEKFL